MAEPVLFPDGGNDGTTGTLRATTGCHDITVYQALDLAAGACTGEGVIMSIRNPLKPKVLANIEDTNFAFWHSATISNDGKKVLFTDELGGGGQPTCNPTVGPKRGADAIYDITDPANPRFLSYYKIARTQSNTENCVAHNGNLIPNNKGRDLLVQSWYQGGLSVIDWTNGSKPKEIAWFDRGPIDETQARHRRQLVDLLLQRPHLRLGDLPRLRRLHARRRQDGQAVQGHAERPDAGSARATEAQARPSANSVPRASPAASISCEVGRLDHAHEVDHALAERRRARRCRRSRAAARRTAARGCRSRRRACPAASARRACPRR